MTYEPAMGRIVVFGGASEPFTHFPFRDTWFYDGSSWQPGPTAPRALAPGFAMAMAYDTDRTRIVMVGSNYAQTAQTWELIGGAWSLRATPQTLGPRRGAAIAYDEAHHAMVLFGGFGTQEGMSETWFYSEAISP